MLSLYRWISYLPLGLLHALGAWLGWAGFTFSGNYRQRFRDHAKQAGVASEQWRPAIGSAGRMVMELPYLWLRPPTDSILPHIRFEGEDLLQQAIDRGNGVLILTPHMGCFEVIAQAVAERFGPICPLTALYRPARQHWLRELLKTSRQRPYLATAPATLAGVRQMIRALRRGEIVGLLPDQVPPDGMGVWAPFFGRPAYTMTLAARLAQQTQAPLLLTWGERLPHAEGYVLRFFAFPEALPDDPVAAATAINRAIEGLVRQCPQQYLWGYNRYKTPRPQTPDELPLRPKDAL